MRALLVSLWSISYGFNVSKFLSRYLFIPMLKLPHFVLILMAVFLLTSCRSDIGFVEGSFRPGQAEVSLSGSNLSMNFPASSGFASVDLDASGKWTASFVNDRSKDWCSLSAENGSRGKATITVSVKENTDYDQRSASINFVCGDVQRTIVVTQKQKDALLVTSNRLDVDNKGGNITVEVKANVEFEYSISESAKSWITPVGTKGLKTSQLLFKVDTNEDLDKREGAITITSSVGQETVRVYQDGATPTLIISTSQINLPATDTSFQVDVRRRCRPRPCPRTPIISKQTQTNHSMPERQPLLLKMRQKEWKKR